MSVGSGYKITSEIHENTEKDQTSKPSVSLENVISKFTFTYPKYSSSEQNGEVQVDEDGDLIVCRRNSAAVKEVIYVEHSPSTTLDLVGLQIWRGSLLLADFVLHHGHSIFKDSTVLELGSGVGLTSIVAGMFAKEVVCTDIDAGSILKLIKGNAVRNKKLITAKFSVYGLDFFSDKWSQPLTSKLRDVSVILAADVIYDDDVTEAFVKTVSKILDIPSNRKTIYIALEKRYVFTIADLDCVAPCYEHFLSCLKKYGAPHWIVQQIPIDFPQYFNYERVKELVLWRITVN